MKQETLIASDVLANILRTRSIAYKMIDVTPGIDHDGDDVLYMDVYFDFSKEPIDPFVFNFVTTELREALEVRNERRFPHIRYHFDQKQKVKGCEAV